MLKDATELNMACPMISLSPCGGWEERGDSWEKECRDKPKSADQTKYSLLVVRAITSNLSPYVGLELGWEDSVLTLSSPSPTTSTSLLSPD